MKVRFVEEASSELLDAISYYEQAHAGLGERFSDEIDRCVKRIAENPELHRLRPGGYRRINLRTFPYYLSFFTHDQTLWVLAVGHASRRPCYWISRRKIEGG